ncbi:MAG TPA: hypothetical protein VGC30_15225, partial [Dokdonella sp.]
MPTWRDRRSVEIAVAVEQRLDRRVRRAAGRQKLQAFGAAARIRLELRDERADARLRIRNAGTDREIVRGDRDAAVAVDRRRRSRTSPRRATAASARALRETGEHMPRTCDRWSHRSFLRPRAAAQFGAITPPRHVATRRLAIGIHADRVAGVPTRRPRRMRTTRARRRGGSRALPSAAERAARDERADRAHVGVHRAVARHERDPLANRRMRARDRGAGMEIVGARERVGQRLHFGLE